MSDSHFRRLEKYRTGGTKQKMELKLPAPKTPSGKVYRSCPNEDCVPRLFLLGDGERPERSDSLRWRRNPGTPGTTCPYCGTAGDDDAFTYEGDIEAVKNYVKWAATLDIEDQVRAMFQELARSLPRDGPLRIQVNHREAQSPAPRAWREDLIRNLSCSLCGREYGVYAIALFCPDCASPNLHVHFRREVELVLQQIDLAEQIKGAPNDELAYRILGNAHEDVLTALETYQKTTYRYLVKKTMPKEDAETLTAKAAIGNRFQNIDRATELYRKLGIDPFAMLNPDEMRVLGTNIEKRHVIGHNLSMADEAYADAADREKPGTTVELLADGISEFAQIAEKVVLELESHL